MKVLVIGSGGREHALCWKFARCESVSQVFCAPGNAGIAKEAKCVPLKVDDIDGLRVFATENKIDLTVVGPELPLTLGICDAFEAAGLNVFGPVGKAAQLEGSKIFAKEFMREFGIPTADFEVFDSYEAAAAHLENAPYPTVIKADGLAAGKGVLVTSDKAEALEFARQTMVEKVFGSAGNRLLVEKCLVGEECSILALTDGKDLVVLTPSQDHKRAFDNDEGPNTGGMGAYSPVSIAGEELLADIRAKVLEPVVEGMKKRGYPFKGVIYAGMMLTADGPSVLEFNVRFGDPEAQAVIPLIEGDLAQLCLAGAKGSIASVPWKPASRSALCLVMASEGYPGAYKSGVEITGLAEAEAVEDVTVFHAGTALADGKIVTAGGRVLGVTGIGANLAEAKEKAYKAAAMISGGLRYRSDVGNKDIFRNK